MIWTVIFSLGAIGCAVGGYVSRLYDRPAKGFLKAAGLCVGLAVAAWVLQ